MTDADIIRQFLPGRDLNGIPWEDEDRVRVHAALDRLERKVGQLTADLLWTEKQLRKVKKTKHRLERERDEALGR